jgi:hypothetical protein
VSYQPPPHVPGQPPHGQPYQQLGQPYGAPPPGYQVQQPPKKSNTLKVVLLTLAGVLVLCVGGSVIAAVAGAGDTDSGKSASSDTPALDGLEAPVPDDAADKGRFGLKLGTTVKFTTADGAQSVTVKSVKAFKGGCDGLSEPKQGMYVVVDVTVAVTKGTASINALNFEWVGDDGTTANALSGLFSGCEKNSLDTATDARAGQKRSGQIVYDVPSAKGSIEFAQDAFGSAEASWKAA